MCVLTILKGISVYMCAGLAVCGVSVSPCEWDRIEKAVLEGD